MLLKPPFSSVYGVKDQNKDNIDTSEFTFKYSENIVIFNFHIICRNLSDWIPKWFISHQNCCDLFMCSLIDSPENAKYESLFDSEILNYKLNNNLLNKNINFMFITSASPKLLNLNQDHPSKNAVSLVKSL